MTANFDRVARVYRWAEYLALGPLLERTRTHFLAELCSCRQAFVLGDGDGRFLSRFLQQNPEAKALAVDTSAAMLKLLRRRCGPSSRLTTLCASALVVDISPKTDLIVTHFFLDCLTQLEVEHLASRFAQAVSPGTLWLLSDFRVPDRPLLRHFAAGYIRLLYFAFRVLTGLCVQRLPDPQKALSVAGFSRVAAHQSLAGILYTELWQRSSGAPTQPSPRSPHLSYKTMNDTEATPDRPAEHLPSDAQPDPEPASPSLPGPDLGVFHHDTAPAADEGVQ